MMRQLLIAFSPSQVGELPSEQFVVQIFDKLFELDRSIGSRRRIEPKSLRCHVMNSSWVIRTTTFSPEEVADFLRKFVPADQPFIVAEINGEWVASNGAMTAGRCFTW